MTSNLDSQPDQINSQESHPWNRYVAIGDSFTEGIGDPEEKSPGGFRGWADRLAEELGRDHPDFSYANLAIRGRLMGQILGEQLEPALALKPDLISISAGGNDLIRPGSDPDALAEQLDGAISKMSQSGATVLLFTGPDPHNIPVLGVGRGKVAVYNENLRTIAARHDAIVADMWALRELADPQMWVDDRLHCGPLGHHRIAMMALDALNVKHSLEADFPPPLPPLPWRAARAEDLVWAREFLVPWVIRRLRHQSSGDGITAKRPTAGPVSPSPVFPSVDIIDPKD